VSGFNSSAAKTFTIKITGGATSSKNYTISKRENGTLTVADKIPATISGISVAGKTYNGTAVTPAGTVSVKAGDITVSDYTPLVYTYAKLSDGSVSDAAPKGAGDYTLVVSAAPGDPKYTGASAAVNFTIAKATITITVTDQSATAGSAEPTYTYTVSGLAPSEKLAKNPTASCPTANMNAAGSYPIIVSGAEVPDTGTYHTAIIYKNGTLTVSASGGTATPETPITPVTPPEPDDGDTTSAPDEPKEKPAPWAAAAVEEAIDLGLVPTSLQSGYNNRITRAEFSALVVSLYEAKTGIKLVAEKSAFTDTDDENVGKLAVIGVVAGGGSGEFKPDALFTREMALRVFYNALLKIGYVPEVTEPAFDDAALISPWAKEAIGALQRSDIVTGDSNNNFKPKDNMTRQEAIAATLKFWKALKEAEDLAV
jgi:hypothetical protein